MFDLRDSFIEKLLEELELRDVACRKAAEHVKQELNLVVMLSATQRNVTVYYLKTEVTANKYLYATTHNM